jgi:steroid 5-alpha reductase family enzyme
MRNKGLSMNADTRRGVFGTLIAVLIAAGLALSGSQGSASAYGFPVFAICIAIAFIIQWIAFIPSYIYRTEKFYDLTGGITYLSVIAVAVRLSPTVDARTMIMAGMVTLWAIRLSTFLYRRIHAAGEDRRFREIKQSFPRFLLAWTLQALWVSFSLAAALAAITSNLRAELGAYAIIGFLVWLFGFAFEVIADRQKSAFKAQPENKDKFITSGLWSWSRHPNYFGEIVLWFGVTIIALPVLQGWQWVTLISPIFIVILLTKISGVNLLEARADEKWGGQKDYETYKAKTPVLIPKPPSKQIKEQDYAKTQ